jgi:hypothetical protein
MHQTGGGVVLPVWAACFGEQWRNESGKSWKYCGDSVLRAGLGQLYPFGHANFTDRHKGAHFFGQSIPGIISLHCTKHIIENARHYVENSHHYVENARHYVENARQYVENARHYVENARHYVENARH